MPNYSESLPELFIRVSKAQTEEEKINILKSAEGPLLHTILHAAFDPNIKFALPSGAPPYKKEEAGYGNCPSVLEGEFRKLVYFLEGHPQMVQNTIKRESMFINILECLHPSESELLIQMKDKNIKCDGLTYELICKIWPGLLPEPVKKEKKVKTKE